MEIMDRALIEATDNFSKAGYPRDAELLLIVELDGTESEVNELLKKVSEISKKNNCSSLKLSKNEQERLKFWGLPYSVTAVEIPAGLCPSRLAKSLNQSSQPRQHQNRD